MLVIGVLDVLTTGCDAIFSASLVTTTELPEPNDCGPLSSSEDNILSRLNPEMAVSSVFFFFGGGEVFFCLAARLVTLSSPSFFDLRKSFFIWTAFAKPSLPSNVSAVDFAPCLITIVETVYKPNPPPRPTTMKKRMNETLPKISVSPSKYSSSLSPSKLTVPSSARISVTTIP